MSRSLTDWLDWQEKLHLSEIDLGLDRIGQVAGSMGILHVPFPVITVAGTNGKGSSVAMLESILRAQGFRTGAYTSPHLLRYNERIALNGEPAADQLICDAFEVIDNARDKTSLTYFEFGTLAAMYCFQQQAVDVAILEVGLGGRLDATNLWDADLALITGIAIDHTSWLGNSREAIAGEKAGIMRAGKPVVCGDPKPPGRIAAVAKQKHALLYQLGEDFFYQSSATDQWTWRWQTNEPLKSSLHDNNNQNSGAENEPDSLQKTLPIPALSGQFQLNNAATVVAGLYLIRDLLPVTDQSIENGLRSVKLAGRLQLLNRQPDWLVDVAHNPQSAEQLAQCLSRNPVSGDQLALFSMLEDKEIEKVVKLIMPFIDEWHLVELKGNRGLNAKALRDRMTKAGVTRDCYYHDSFESACSTLRKRANLEDRVVAFGSFLLVSGVLKNCKI